MSLEKLFHLKENRTDIKTEIIAGVTTFMTMAYILAVNPGILGEAGMDTGAVFTATALSALIASLLMAVFSNYPFVLAPGMGINAYFAYTVVLQLGYSWQMALAAVFLEGLIFIVLSLTNVREAIFNSIPINLKYAVSAGIGLYIAFIGMQNAKVVVGSSTLVSMYSFTKSIEKGLFRSEGMTVLLAFVGILITGILLAKKVKGNILWGMMITWGLGIICQLTGIYRVDPSVGAPNLLPDFSAGIAIPSMAPTFMKMDFSFVFTLDFFVIMFAFLFVDLFDTLGTVIGVASRADMLDEKGRLPKIRGVLLSDAIGTSVGAVLGTSTVSTYVESSSGVAEGGRTGLTSVVAAVLFGLSLFLSPLFLAVPSFATAPALIVVGFLMVTSILKIDFDDFTEAIPAFMSIIAMPFMYSISDGISMGIISYTVINLLAGNARKKKISPLLYGLSVLFILKYALL